MISVLIRNFFSKFQISSSKSNVINNIASKNNFLGNFKQEIFAVYNEWSLLPTQIDSFDGESWFDIVYYD